MKGMKKLWSFVLAVCIISAMFAALPLTVSADTEGYYTYAVSNGEAIITDCDTSISGDIIIPDTLGGYPVTSIGTEAFSLCYSLESVKIPNSVISIGGGAFSDCENLTSVTIGNNVTSIGDLTFSYCSSLQSVTIPDSVISIGDEAFSYCASLKSITIGNGLTSIGKFAFDSCNSLENIDVDEDNLYYCDLDGNLFNKDQTTLLRYASGKQNTSYELLSTVTSISDGAFYNCRSLQSVTIPDSVTSIGSGAFSNCVNLTSVTIGNNVTIIGESAFDNCRILQNINIPNSVTTIGEMAFYNCRSLQSIIIPGSVTSIGYGTFYYCTSLQSAIIGNSVASIGDEAFSYCRSLQSITIPGSITSIGDWAFDGCSNLQDVYYYGPANQWANIDIGFGNDSLTNADIYYRDNPAEIKSIVCIYDSGKVTAQIQFYDLIQNGIVTAAVYDKGKLVTLKTIPVTANNLDYSVEFDADESYKDYDVKVLCWDSTESLKPLSKAYETVIIEPVITDAVLESAHPYNDNIDETKIYTYDGICKSIDVTFTEDTYVEDDYDYIYIYDRNDILIGEYTGGMLAGTTVRIPGNTVKIRITSDDSENEYGYRTESIVVNK